MWDKTKKGKIIRLPAGYYERIFLAQSILENVKYMDNSRLVDKSFMVPRGEIVELQRCSPRELLVARPLHNSTVSPRGTINDLSTSLG